MKEAPQSDPTAEVRILITDKAVRDFERVLEQLTAKAKEPIHANDNNQPR